MHFYLYQITNNVNGKIYAGVHKTTDLDDGYMGSGKVIKAAIKKYGIENFTKEILTFFDNSADMFAAEKELVTDDFLLREDTYNLRRGGTGGFDYINANGLRVDNTEKTKLFLRPGKYPKDVMKAKGTFDDYCDRMSESLKTAHAEGRHTGFTGKCHTNSAKQKIAEAANCRDKSKHSQLGTMWITNNTDNRKIKKTDLIPDGWHRGRVTK